MAIATVFTAALAKQLLTYISGHTLKMALIKASAAGSYGKDTASYATLTGNSDEVSGTGYSAGGKTLSGVTVGQGGTDNFVSWITFDAVAWTTASFTARGALIYDTNLSDVAVATIDFGADLTVASGTFTVTPPATGYQTAALRLAV